MPVFIGHNIEYEYMISDEEIALLAQMSRQLNGRIKEYRKDGLYHMELHMVRNGENKILTICKYSNGDKYLEATKDFWTKFKKYNGDIDLGTIFGKPIYS